MSLQLKHYLMGGPIVRHFILDASEVIGVGYAAEMRNGNVELGSTIADAALCGVVQGFTDRFGLPYESSTATRGSSTFTGTGDSLVVTVASTNETVDMIKAIIEMSPYAVYSATVTGTMNTTNASSKAGGWIDMDDSDSVEETTMTRTITVGGQLNNWGEDPEDTTRMLVSIHEHEFFNNNGVAAA